MEKEKPYGTRRYLLNTADSISLGSINSLLAQSPSYSSRLINALDALEGEDVIVLCSKDNTPAHKINDDYTKGIFIRARIDKVVQAHSSIYFLTFQKNTNKIILPEIDIKYIHDVVSVKEMNAVKYRSGTLDTLKVFRFDPVMQDRDHLPIEINQYEAFGAYKGVEHGYRNMPLQLIRIDELVGKIRKLNE